MAQFCVRGFFLLLLIVFATEFSRAEGQRIALVVGNSSYVNTPRLRNPGNDAMDMAARLKELGFKVLSGMDLDKTHMDALIRDFADSLPGSEVGLFYYAGHGLQVRGENYLVPIDAKLTTAASLDFEMVPLNLVQKTMERETQTNIIILDACRDNPLARNLARTLGTRSPGFGVGLAKVESGEGTLISFSTQPGNVALDGEDRNSPFAAALLKHIHTPGDDLSSILINVRNDVMKTTARRQIPWENSALTAKFYFIFPPSPGPTGEQQMEMQFWDSVKNSSNPSVLKSYLSKYPNGTFAPLAHALIDQFEKQIEEQRTLKEQENKAAELRRLEEEGKAHQSQLEEKKKESDDSQNAGKTKRDEEQRIAEERKHAEELKKAWEDVRIAQETAKAAIEQRKAAEKAAEAARREAQAAAAKPAEPKDETKRSVSLPKPQRPSAMAYSKSVWEPGSIAEGEHRSANTPYGRLVCTGGNFKTGRSRECSWN